MCYTLDAEKILLNYFATKQEVNRISFKSLNEISCKIVKKCENSIVSRVTIEEIETAVWKRPDLLQLNLSSVSIIDRDNVLLKNMDIFNSNVPKFIIDNCNEVFEEYEE